jgi:transmembrane sensor
MSEIGMELLERYLADQVTSEERRRVDAWLAEDPRRWAELTALREALEKRDLDDEAVERAVAEVWARLSSEMGAEGETPIRIDTRGTGRHRRFTVSGEGRKRALALVAAIALMIGGWYVATLLLRSRPGPDQMPRVAITAPGERATLYLPDGTRVMLGVASTLRHPAEFPAGSREVSLEGEALFDVASDQSRPFVVQAGDLVAQQVGTEFTVRAYSDDAGARVVVREGRVAIRASADSVERIVGPGQLGRLVGGRVPTVEPADTAALFAWTHGMLVFDGTPLREALPQLNRWFDLDFRLADSTLEAVPLTATLRTRPTDDLLESLAASLGMRHRRQGRVVTLYSSDTLRH